MFNFYMLDGVLDKIKMIKVIQKLDDNKKFINSDNKLAEAVALKSVVTVTLHVILNHDKFYPQLFLEELLVT